MLDLIVLGLSVAGMLFVAVAFMASVVIAWEFRVRPAWVRRRARKAAEAGLPRMRVVA